MNTLKKKKNNKKNDIQIQRARRKRKYKIGNYTMFGAESEYVKNSIIESFFLFSNFIPL